jgi:hypothetical protein
MTRQASYDNSGRSKSQFADNPSSNERSGVRPYHSSSGASVRDKHRGDDKPKPGYIGVKNSTATSEKNAHSLRGPALGRIK